MKANKHKQIFHIIIDNYIKTDKQNCNRLVLNYDTEILETNENNKSFTARVGRRKIKLNFTTHIRTIR